MTDPELKYDVAFSFLYRDLDTAHRLGDLLTGLSVFIFDRKKEELLGGNGMDVFGQTFGHDTRLTVILHRAGWGETPWTGYEASHIQGRALRKLMASFLVVRLDEGSQLPKWVPEQHIWVPLKDEGLAGTASIIRLRAKERGAVVKKLSVAEAALEQSAKVKRKAEREARARSPQAAPEIRQERSELYAAIESIVAEIKAGDPAFRVQAGSRENECGMSGGGVSTSLVLYQAPDLDSPHHLVLRVNEWQGNRAIPGIHQNVGGGDHVGATHYVPALADDEQWGWRYQEEHGSRTRGLVFIGFADNRIISTSELADKIVSAHVARLHNRG